MMTVLILSLTSIIYYNARSKIIIIPSVQEYVTVVDAKYFIMVVRTSAGSLIVSFYIRKYLTTD